MEYLIGIVLLITFFGLVVYCFKGHNLMVGFLIMSVLWTVIPLLGNYLVANPAFFEAHPGLRELRLVALITDVFQKAPEGWGSTLVNYLWGTWFGRVLLETGIAGTLIRKTVELSGDRPVITVALLNIVTAVIFTSMLGAGPVIAIGVIVLPIFMSLGIPKPVALFTFMASVAAGLYMNPILFTLYRGMFIAPAELPEFTLAAYGRAWGIPAVAIAVAATIVVTAFALRGSGKARAWAAQRPAPADEKNAPALALVAPILPVASVILFNLPVIFGFIVAGFYALFLCKRLSGGFANASQLVGKLFYEGTVDTAPLAGFLLTLPMFNKVSGLVAPYFQAIFGGVIPGSTLMFCIAFAALSCLGLFRGPLTLGGSGAAVLGIVRNLGFGVPFLYVCFVIPTITMMAGSCITQSQVAWGLGYTKVSGREFLRYSVVNGYIVSILLYALSYAVYGG